MRWSKLVTSGYQATGRCVRRQGNGQMPQEYVTVNSFGEMWLEFYSGVSIIEEREFHDLQNPSASSTWAKSRGPPPSPPEFS